MSNEDDEPQCPHHAEVPESELGKRVCCAREYGHDGDCLGEVAPYGWLRWNGQVEHPAPPVSYEHDPYPVLYGWVKLPLTLVPDRG